MGGSRLSLMSVFLAPPPLNQRPRPGDSRIGHDGSDGSKPIQRAARAGYHPKIASENVASGQKSFSDVMHSWEGSSGHRENLLRPEVTAVGVAMAKNSSGWPYWTLVLGAEKANAKIEGVPCHPTLRLTQSSQAKSCRSSDSLLTGQVAGPVLLLPRRPKAFVIRCKTTIA